MADKYQTQCPNCSVKFQITAQQLALANGNVRCGSCLQVFQASQHLVPLSSSPPPSGVGSARSPAAPKAAPTPAKPAAPAPAASRPAAPAPAKPTAPKAPPAAAHPPAKPKEPEAPAAAPAKPDVPLHAQATQVRAAIKIPPPRARTEDDDLAERILRELEDSPAVPTAKAPAPKAAVSATPPPQNRVPPKAPPVAAPPAAAPPPTVPGIDDDLPEHAVDDSLADMIFDELEDQQASGAGGIDGDEPQWSPAGGGIRDESDIDSGKPGVTAESVAKKYGIEDNKTRISIGHTDDDVLDSLIDDGPEDLFTDQKRKKDVIQDEDDIFGASEKTLLENIDEPVDESWAKELLGEKVEDERDARVRKFTELTADKLSLAQTGTRKKSALEKRLDQMSGSTTGSIDDDPDDLDFLNDPSLRMQDVELPQLGVAEEPEPANSVHQVVWSRDIFWGVLATIFVLLLAGQYLLFNFDTLSRTPQWRGVYEVACGAVGCTLPSTSDVGRIQGANLVIRNHPSVPGVLLVDAIVYNRAPFDQPFPDLELYFSDNSGKVVAGRVFKPAEYLGGELSGTDTMPPDVPVHLSLQLVDPGTGASNYEMRFLPPAT